MKKIKLFGATIFLFLFLAFCFGDFSKRDKMDVINDGSRFVTNNDLGESSVLEETKKIDSSTSEILDDIKKDLDDIKNDLDEILKILKERINEKKSKENSKKESKSSYK